MPSPELPRALVGRVTVKRFIATAAAMIAGASVFATAVEAPKVAAPPQEYGQTGRTVQFDPFDAQASQSRTATAKRLTEEEPSLPAGVNVLALASRPQSDRTIYLDVTGGVIPAESGWINNGLVKDPLPYPTYSIDADPAFSADEQARIYAAWDAVVEDFAPFDVNVTTIRPAMSDLVRTNATDTRFGVQALISPMGTAAHRHICDGWCTGMGFLNGIQYTIPGTDKREAQPEPVWVFANPDFTGAGIGDAASHEIGHQLGLKHDGYDQADYYSGTYFWAPIMGSNDGSAAVTQWSDGGYAHANNFEDDYALMARWLPRLPDDFPGIEAPTPITGTTLGAIESAADTDAFIVPASGKTTITATPTAATPNLDLAMSVYATDGTLIEYRDSQPGTGQGRRGHLSVSWTGAAPTDGVVRVVLHGTGLATNAGSYSDYGSVGRYRLDVADEPTTLRWEGPSKPKGLRVGRYTQHKWKVRGADGYKVTLTRTGAKPRGMRIALDNRTKTVVLSKAPRRAGTYKMTFTVTDRFGDTQSINVSIKVKKAKKTKKGHRRHNPGGRN